MEMARVYRQIIARVLLGLRKALVNCHSVLVRIVANLMFALLTAFAMDPILAFAKQAGPVSNANLPFATHLLLMMFECATIKTELVLRRILATVILIMLACNVKRQCALPIPLIILLFVTLITDHA